MGCSSAFVVVKTSRPAATHRSRACSKTFVQVMYRSGGPLSVRHDSPRLSSPSTNSSILSAAGDLPSRPVRAPPLHAAHPAD
ncbi:hypothetical protein [Streptomyces sp. NRRL F-5053]|uniref:hypothetical protein n=1 Tax=Streptomyces sp. NRRL F-5053 TaxID=1463854 RepID=UPI0004C80137|nr:hypothetical protein [Streptomyces sp. NRRL F-5053]